MMMMMIKDNLITPKKKKRFNLPINKFCAISSHEHQQDGWMVCILDCATISKQFMNKTKHNNYCNETEQ